MDDLTMSELRSAESANDGSPPSESLPVYSRYSRFHPAPWLIHFRSAIEDTVALECSGRGEIPAAAVSVSKVNLRQIRGILQTANEAGPDLRLDVFGDDGCALFHASHRIIEGTRPRPLQNDVLLGFWPFLGGWVASAPASQHAQTIKALLGDHSRVTRIR